MWSSGASMDDYFCCFLGGKGPGTFYERLRADEDNPERLVDYTSDSFSDNPSYIPPTTPNSNPNLKQSASTDTPKTPFDYTSAGNQATELQEVQDVCAGKYYRVVLPQGLDVRAADRSLSKVIDHCICGEIVRVLEVKLDLARIDRGWIKLSNLVGKHSLAADDDTNFLITWSLDDVLTWLSSIDREDLQYQFINVGIDGFNLMNLTVGGLVEHPFNMKQRDAENFITQIMDLQSEDGVDISKRMKLKKSTSTRV